MQFRSLEDALSLVLTMSKKGPVSLERIIKIFSCKSECFILLFLSLVGFSVASFPYARIVVGGLSIYLGFCIGLGFNILLPDFLLQKKFRARFFVHSAKFGIWSIKKMRRFIRPRLEILCHHKVSRIVNGLLFASLGAAFAVTSAVGMAPLLLIISLFLLSLGLLEDDGFLVLFGYIEAVTAFAFLLI